MGVHDLIFTWLGNDLENELARTVLEKRRVVTERLSRELPIILERQADFAVIVRWPRPEHVLHIEHIKGRAALRRVALYQAAYHELTGLPVRTVILQTSRRAARAIPDVYRYGLRRLETCVPLTVLKVFDLQAEEVLRRGLVAFYPFLGQMRRRVGPRALLEMARDRIIQQIPAGDDRKDMLAALSVVSAEVIATSTVEHVLGGIAKMAESKLGRKLIEMGLEKGLEKGRAEGRAEGQIGALLLVLESRFGPLPEALRARVTGLGGDVDIDRLLRLVGTAPSVSAFERELPGS